MQELLIITPVKDSIDHTIRTMEAVVQSELTVPHRYVVYNDNRRPKTRCASMPKANGWAWK